MADGTSGRAVSRRAVIVAAAATVGLAACSRSEPGARRAGPLPFGEVAPGRAVDTAGLVPSVDRLSQAAYGVPEPEYDLDSYGGADSVDPVGDQRAGREPRAGRSRAGSCQ